MYVMYVYSHQLFTKMKSYRPTIISLRLVPRNSNDKQYMIVICDISTSNKSVARCSAIEILKKINYHIQHFDE